MKKAFKRLLGLGMLVLLCFVCAVSLHAQNTTVVADLLNRIGGEGTSARFVTTVDASMAQMAKMYLPLPRKMANLA